METLTEGIERIETSVQPKEIIEVEGDRLVMVERWHPRGRQGIETEAPVAIAARYREGLMTRFKDYGDIDQGLEAVGLRE